MKALLPDAIDKTVKAAIQTKKKGVQFCGCKKPLAKDLCDAALHVVAKGCLSIDELPDRLKTKVLKYRARRHVCGNRNCSFSTLYASSRARHSRTCKHAERDPGEQGPGGVNELARVPA